MQEITFNSLWLIQNIYIDCCLMSNLIAAKNNWIYT